MKVTRVINQVLLAELFFEGKTLIFRGVGLRPFRSIARFGAKSIVLFRYILGDQDKVLDRRKLKIRSEKGLVSSL